MHAATLPALLLVLSPAFVAAAPVERRVEGPPASEDVPRIPAALAQRLQRYGDTRGAVFAGWLPAAPGLLVSTRFGSTSQVHWVKSAGDAPSQLTFDDEPVASVAVHPQRNGFVFGRDASGSESYQLHWFDLDTRELRLLTDGRSRNTDPLFSRDGHRLAWSSTARNGVDTDVWVMDFDGGASRAVVAEGGTWIATDFSPDGRHLLAQRRISTSEALPVSVDLDTGTLKRIHDPERRIGFDAFLYAPDGRGAWFIANDRRGVRELRYRNLASDRDTRLSAHIDGDVTEFTLSRDGRRLAFVANEDGFGTLHLLDTRTRREIRLPALPKGIVFGPDFSADGRRLAFTLNAAVSPSDTWVIDLDSMQAERWTGSEAGGLDSRRFITPELVRYPTFDSVRGRPRLVPAFYYRPPPRADGAPHPVVIDIHGGPEAQARPSFSASTQFLANELGIAVLMPNVRGSAGYGRTWLDLDNGGRREDAVRDIGALLDWIALQPELDADRVGVSGNSYGGYMVLATMIAYGARVRAGIDVAGISDFVTFLTRTEDYRRDQRRVEYGDERDPRMRAFLERISPLAQAGRITRPLFVAHGSNDPRVPVGEARQIVERVRANGGEVWYLEFADEGHGFRRKANIDRFRAASMLFWQRHLLDATDGEADDEADSAAAQPEP